MENRVYYGQYSLKHWVELILQQNIILPNYQRYFVWDESRVKNLVETFKQKQFVPPITIGAFKVDQSSNVNYILDGQQRLTSIFLAYLQLFPDKSVYKATKEKLIEERLADENDDEDDELEDALDDVLEWDLSQLTKKGKNRSGILTGITPGNYKNIDYQVDEAFFKNNYLGFSYLVPDTVNPQAQQRYYSSVFRNINVQGQALLAQESRASLYFLNEGLVDFFNPELSKTITVKYINSESKADFVRFLSLLSQYEKDGNNNKLARGFKQKMENYYEDYIYSVVGERSSHTFVNFADLFPDGNYKPRFDKLRESFEQLDFKKQFSSIIDLDLYLFGLIYQIVFKDKSIDLARKEDLHTALESKITELKTSDAHRKAPAALKYLKERISSSIEIFNRFIHE
ncbi:DUF262 domain-containing protein [Fluviicola sp.]|uniref:DUF262 domain-containing protein n=1 Tax=Fluviicola sp. TaxID=1917219 RepID=UPI0031DC3F6C